MSHTLVLDIGKTNAKLLLIDASGEVLARESQPNEAVQGANYLELGLGALEAWLLRTIPTLPERDRIAHISISTHGAAFCAIDGQGLVMPPIDYEWDGYGAHREAFRQIADDFQATGSPDLPLGLNAGLQLYWLQKTQPDAWHRIRHWLPYPQYWAWWFSGVAASEVTSLGCHTHLWLPKQGRPSAWARKHGIDDLLAPLRTAWEVLGPVKPELASRLQLPADCVVHAGVHDSNACLARHLRAVPGGTVVSTGTWCVVMAPGGTTDSISAKRDELMNVSVEGRPIPTARFMAGREFAALCGGADHALATMPALDEVLRGGWVATPSFAAADGPHQRQPGQVWKDSVALGAGVMDVPSHLRPALASLYCADVAAQLVSSLSPDQADSDQAVVLEGPLASNVGFTTALSVFMRGRNVLRTNDKLEGTARGAWMLANWGLRAELSGWYEPVPAAEVHIRLRLGQFLERRKALSAKALT